MFIIQYILNKIKNRKEELSHYRIKAHRYFDLLWTSGLVKRKEAYALLPYLMHNKNSYNIKKLSIRQCKKLIKVLKKKYPYLYEGNVTLENDLFYP